MGNKIKEEFEKHSGLTMISALLAVDNPTPANDSHAAILQIKFHAGGHQRILAGSLDTHGFLHVARLLGEQARNIVAAESGGLWPPPREMPAVDRGAEDGDVDTELYLREGSPFAVAAKVTLKDGRIGIGIARQDPSQPGALGLDAMDKAAKDDALENMPKVPPDRAANLLWQAQIGDRDSTDLQAQLGQPAHEG